MKFFRAEDFNAFECYTPLKTALQAMADVANNKLEKEGIVVYSIGRDSLFASDYEAYFQNKKTHKALLINIERIENGQK